MESDLNVEIEEEENNESVTERLIPSECEVTLRTEPNYLQDLTKQLELISSRLIEGLVKVNTTVTNLDHQLSQEMCNLSEGMNARFHDLVERQEVLEDRVVRLMTDEFDERKGKEQFGERRGGVTGIREKTHKTDPVSTRSGDKSKDDFVPSTQGTCVEGNEEEEASIPPDSLRGKGLRRSVRLMEKRSSHRGQPPVLEANLPGPSFSEGREEIIQKDMIGRLKPKIRSLGYSNKQEDLAPSLEYTDSDFKNGDEDQIERTEAEKRLVSSRSDPEHISNMSGRVLKLNGDREERNGREERERKLEGHRYQSIPPSYGPPHWLEPGHILNTGIRTSLGLESVRNLVPPVDVNPDYRAYRRALVEGNNIQNDVRNWETPVPTYNYNY